MAARPAEARYTKTHEWVVVKGDQATVGITDFAVEHLGDLVFVQLPEKGRALKEGEVAAEVESVKAVGEVYAPVSGTVVEVNSALAEDQSPLAKDPFAKGWLFKLKVKAGAGTNHMDLKAYEKQLASEAK
jgi:glycine cleavage system H protein